MPDDQQPASKTPDPPNWVQIATMVVASLGFLGTASLGVANYLADSQFKEIEATLARLNGQVAQYEANGSVDYSYTAQLLESYCGSTKDLKKYEERYNGSENIYDGYLEDSTFNRAVNILDINCKNIDSDDDRPSQAETQAHENLSASLGYFEVKSTTSRYNPNATLHVSIFKAVKGRKIWDYKGPGDRQEVIPIGILTNVAPVKLPLAIVRDGEVETPELILPTSISWTSPITGQEVTSSVGFILPGKYWRAIQSGEVRSGA